MQHLARRSRLFDMWFSLWARGGYSDPLREAPPPTLDPNATIKPDADLASVEPEAVDAVDALGHSLLTADDRQALDRLLENAVQAPETTKTITAYLARVSGPPVYLYCRDRAGPTWSRRTAALVRRAGLLDRSITAAQGTLHAAVEPPIFSLTPLALTTHPQIPSAVMELVFARWTGWLAACGLRQAVAQADPRETAWLHEALAELYVEGRLATLRMLAGVGAAVPEEFVSAADRLDIPKLYQMVQKERQEALGQYKNGARPRPVVD